MRALRRAAVATAVMLVTGTGVATAVTGGTSVDDGQYPFVAKLLIGDSERSCSGVLVHPQLILTSAACFAGPGGVVETGEPTNGTTAVVGRADVATGTNGQTSVVTDVIAHPDRDIVLAKLATAVTGVTPIAIATTAPAVGDTLTLAGYGRTADEWITARMKSARFTVDAVDAATLGVVPATDGTGNICRGDAGGPAFRGSGSTLELVALHHESNQAGCLGETAGTPRATETRLDDIGPWVKANLPGFASGFEAADPRPDWKNTVNERKGGGSLVAVEGVVPSLTGPELKPSSLTDRHGGTQALLYSGKDTSATKSYAYTVAYTMTKVQVRPDTVLSYWIYPQSKTSNTNVTGSNSTCVAVDLVFTDNTSLRNSGAKDQRGNTVHPAQQCGKLPLDTWTQIVVPVGVLSAGKTIATIGVGYDQPANTGGYRGYVDDLSITDVLAPATFITGLETGETAPGWSNTVATGAPRGGVRGIDGVVASLTGPELKVGGLADAHTGSQILLYSGKAVDPTTSHAYLKAFAPVDLYATTTTRISYWVYPQSKATSTRVSGNNSTCFSVDLILVDQYDASDKSLRGSGAVDQHGTRAHPQHQCGTLTMDTWNFVSIPLGGVANGQQIAEIDFGYDQALGAGGYRGYVDDIRITQ